MFGLFIYDKQKKHLLMHYDTLSSIRVLTFCSERRTCGVIGQGR